MVNENLIPRKKADREASGSRDFFTRFFKSDVTPKRPMSTTINRSIEEVSLLLGDMQNLPRFLENLEEVESLVNGKYNWRFRSQEDGFHELQIPMVIEVEKIKNGFVWESEDAAGFKYSVAILLEPAVPPERGTVARMMVMYDSIAGDLVGVFEKLFGNDADVLSRKNLQRLKAFCEVGHVPTTVGQPSGRDEDQPDSMKH